MNSISLVTTNFYNSLSQSPSSQFAYLRLLYLFDAYQYNPQISSACIQFITEDANGYTKTIYNSSFFFDYQIIIPSTQIIKLKLHLTLNSFETLEGVSYLDCNSFSMLEHVYPIVVPFVSETKKPLGSLFIHLFNTRFEQVAEFNYRRSCLQSNYNSLQALLSKVNAFCKTQRNSQGQKKKGASFHIQRALNRSDCSVMDTREGNSSLIHSPLSESTSTRKEDVKFVILLHQIHQIPVSQVNASFFAQVQIENMTFRTPSKLISNRMKPSCETREKENNQISLAVKTASFGCHFIIENDQVIVSQLDHNSIADNAGIQVGLILESINSLPPPLHVDAIHTLLNRGVNEKTLVFSNSLHHDPNDNDNDK